jgi:hypothetical protein
VQPSSNSRRLIQNGKMSDPQDRPGFLLPRLSRFRKIGKKSRFIAPQRQAWWKATQIVESPAYRHQRNCKTQRQRKIKAPCRAKDSVAKGILFSLGLLSVRFRSTSYSGTLYFSRNRGSRNLHFRVPDFRSMRFPNPFFTTTSKKFPKKIRDSNVWLNVVVAKRRCHECHRSRIVFDVSSAA